MKKLVQPLLVLAALIPLPLGFLLEHKLATDAIVLTSTQQTLIGAGLLLILALAAFWGNDRLRNTRRVMLLMLSPAALSMAIILLRELFFFWYWGGRLVTAARSYFQPFLHIALRIFDSIHSMSAIYGLSFLLLILATLAGCLFSEKRWAE